jgi:hypothetical protein
MRDTTKTAYRIAGLLCIAALTLAACGGSSSHAAASNAPTTTTGGSGPNGTRLAAFRTCMSNHGITLPQRRRTGTGDSGASGASGFTGGSGGGGGGFANRFAQPPAGVDPTKYQDALNACRSQLPTGGGNFNSSAFQAYRSCLQDHGVTLPAQGGVRSLKMSDAKVQAAMKTCQPLLPAGFGRNRSTTPTTAA